VLDVLCDAQAEAGVPAGTLDVLCDAQAEAGVPAGTQRVLLTWKKLALPLCS
jgi:hypothetical protein